MGDPDLVGDISRLIAFDLDGTLIDSRRDLADSANQLITELGGTPLSEDAVAGMVGEGAALLVKRALDAAGLQHPPSALSRFLEIYDTRLVNHTRLYDGIMDVLQSVRRHARLGVLTNKPTAPTERILEAFAIRDLFHSVIGGDGPHPRKPDPQGLLAMMEATGAVPECTVLVGDSGIDYQTAQRASVCCCLVSYGFGFRAFSRDQVSDGNGVVNDAEGLARWLDAWVRS